MLYLNVMNIININVTSCKHLIYNIIAIPNKSLVLVIMNQVNSKVKTTTK